MHITKALSVRRKEARSVIYCKGDLVFTSRLIRRHVMETSKGAHARSVIAAFGGDGSGDPQSRPDWEGNKRAAPPLMRYQSVSVQ